MDGVAAVMARKAPPKRLAVLAEQVRSQAETAKAAPLDNRSALCNVIAAAGMSVQVSPDSIHCSVHQFLCKSECTSNVQRFTTISEPVNVQFFHDLLRKALPSQATMYHSRARNHG